MPTLADVLAARTAEAAPELVEPIARGRLRRMPAATAPDSDGAAGVCKVRFNAAAPRALRAVGGVQCDPIEKKPFFHATPGAASFGMLGCDLHCSYCQNWVTSQALRDPRRWRRHGCLAGAAGADAAARRPRAGRHPQRAAHHEQWAVAVFKAA